MITVPDWYNASVIVDRNLEAWRAEKVVIYYGDEEVTYVELASCINRFCIALYVLGLMQEEWV